MVSREDELSAQVKQALDSWCLQGRFTGVYAHIPNEVRLTRNPHRNKNILIKRERIGVRAGFGDWIILWTGGSGIIELKNKATYKPGKRKDLIIDKPAGTLSEAQEAFKAECELYGINYDVCRGVDDVEVTLEDWNAFN